MPFNTNILRIALNKKETKIAETIVSCCQVQIHFDMMERGIKTRQIDFLYSVYAYNHNYMITNETNDDDSNGDSNEDEN